MESAAVFDPLPASAALGPSAACRICGSVANHVAYRAREMMFGTREEFDYFRCGNCGCLQIAAIPVDMARHYPPQYYSLRQRPPVQKTRPPVAQWLRRAGRALQTWRVRTALFGRGYKLSRLAALAVEPPATLHRYGSWLQAAGIRSFEAAFLDIGCGSWSWWLDALEQLGFRNLHGVDPFIDGDTRHGAARIRRGDIAVAEGPYDLVSLHHVLEHLADQLGTLAAVRDCLKPRGACIVRIPTVSSAVWERYGTDWVELDAPRHFYLHSIESFTRLASDAGFRIVKTFWDSDAFEFYGSEQYRRGIALTADDSFAVNPSNSDFTFREMEEFTRLAAEACRTGRGGRVGFVLATA